MWPFSKRSLPESTPEPKRRYRIIKNGLEEFYIESETLGGWYRFNNGFESLDKAREFVEEQRSYYTRRELAKQTEVVDGPHDY